MTPEQECSCVFSKERNPRQKILDGRINSTHYVRYIDIINRCYNKNHKNFKNYGGRGILMCEQWMKDFYLFNREIANGFNRSLTLDRIDNDKGYCPHNVRWANRMTQTKNRRVSEHRGIRFKDSSYRVFISVGNKQFHHISCKTLEEAIVERDLIYKEWHG